MSPGDAARAHLDRSGDAGGGTIAEQALVGPAPHSMPSDLAAMCRPSAAAISVVASAPYHPRIKRPLPSATPSHQS